MGSSAAMGDAFLIVVIGVSLLALVAAAIALATSGGAYDRIASGGTSVEPETADDRDAEIRQHLAARNARRAARGEPELDAETELRALSGASADPELVAEVRRHVTARNERRVARGQPPLDVEAEVSKRLQEM
jgi:hypothetical protein